MKQGTAGYTVKMLVIVGVAATLLVIGLLLLVFGRGGWSSAIPLLVGGVTLSLVTEKAMDPPFPDKKAPRRDRA